MYFWRTRALSLALREKRVTAEQQMISLLALMVLFPVVRWLYQGFAWDSAFRVDALEPAVRAISFPQMLVAVAINVLGMLACFAANQRGDGADFVPRFVCLFWPVSVRLFVLAVAVVFTASISAALWLKSEFLVVVKGAGLISLLLVAVFEALFYWRMRRHLLVASGAVDARAAKAIAVASPPPTE